MQRFKSIFIALLTLVVIQFIALGALGVLTVQLSSKSDLIYRTYLGHFMGIYRALDRIPNFLYQGPRSPEELPQHALIIPKEEFQKVEESLPYGSNYLGDNKVWVKAKFYADNEEFDVKVRVRGDVAIHWAEKKKSWRIKFPKDHLFRGKREINIILPEDRGWFAESLNAYRAEKMGLKQPPMQFVTVSINGSRPLVYLEIEHWTKEMLEKIGLPGDANFYETNLGVSLYDSTAHWDKYEQSEVSPYDSYEEIDLFRSVARPNAHQEPGFRETVMTLFDLDEVMRWFVHGVLSGTIHLGGDNIRLFFHPSRGRFIPIPWDVHLYEPRALSEYPVRFWKEVFAIPEWRLSAWRMLWEYVDDKDNIEEDEEMAAYLRSIVERAAYRDPWKLMSNRLVRRSLNHYEHLVGENFDSIKDQLQSVTVLITQHIPSNDKRDEVLGIEINASGVSPVMLTELHVPSRLREGDLWKSLTLWRDDGDKVFSNADQNIPLTLREEPDAKGRLVLQTDNEEVSLLWPGEITEHTNEYTTAYFFLRTNTTKELFHKDDLPLKLEVRNAVTMKKVDSTGEVLVDGRTFDVFDEANLDREEFLRRNPLFRRDGDEGVLLSGAHTIRDTLIVPRNVPLRISAGARLRMGSGVSLLSYSPVNVEGTEFARVHIERANQFSPWGVFAVLNAQDDSSVTWADFSGGSDAFINGTFFIGMVDFYQSPVVIRDSTFRNARGDDALNIKEIPADLARLHFEDNHADGLDIDEAPSGVLEDSTFVVNTDAIDSNGDGIDLSWSDVTIRNVSVKNSGDKCISVGENSTPHIYDVYLEGCAMGIAVKDSSNATIERAQFVRNDVAVSAYIKKPIFDAPSATVVNSSFVDNRQNLNATDGATITVDPPL